LTLGLVKLDDTSRERAFLLKGRMHPIVFALLVGLGAANPAPIHDEAGNFSFTVPEGFREMPEARVGNTVYAFIRGVAGQPHYEVMAIQKLDGEIDDGPIDKAAVERGARNSLFDSMSFDYRKTTWRTRQIDIVTSHMKRGSIEAASLAAQMPLRHHAMQITMGSFAADEAQLSADFAQVLASFDGETDLRGGAERIGYALGCYGLPIFLIGWLIVRRRRRKPDPATR
jgi:hypothetical protein